MKQKRRRFYSLILTWLMLCSAVVGIVPGTAIQTVAAEASSVAVVSSSGTGAEDDIQDGVTLHCWNWSYNNITANLDAIAAQGYTAVQTSPIQFCKEATTGKTMGSHWWLYYQPAGFFIDNTGTNALGTKAEFENMCRKAHEKGLKVIVDVVANHMGNQTRNNLSTSIVADIRNDSGCWHDISRNTTDYSKRYDITQYCMDGLPDLNTGNGKIQNYVLNYLKECIDAGADGFRFDGAKHIETPDDSASGCGSNFWPTVINGAKSYAKSARNIDLYCYGEVLDAPDSSGKLPITAYSRYMSVTDNRTGNDVRNHVNNRNAGGAASPYYYNGAAGADKLVLWAESHDTYANNSSSGVSTENINKTWAIVAARNAAMDLYFARPYSGSSALGAADKTGWADKEVAEVNKFHNAFTNQKEYLASSGSIAYCERGNSGVVLVNCSGNSQWVEVSANLMASGTYKDQISGSNFTVENGKIKGQIGNTGIAVVYNISDIPELETENTAYIKLPSGWSEPVYCYAYDSATETKNNGVWPGVQMTSEGDGIYSYKVPGEIEAPRVIFFSSNTNRYPADMEKGLLLKGSMIYENGSWNNYASVETGTVITKFVDENGNELADSITETGLVGSSYITTAAVINGYKWKDTPENAAGMYVDGTITVTYVYEKDVTTGSTAYIELPSGWGSNVYCYAYSADNEAVTNGVWPGVQMTKVSDNIYKYDVPDNISNPLVIFTDKKNQCPGAMQKGFKLDGSMIYKNGSWGVY